MRSSTLWKQVSVDLIAMWRARKIFHIADASVRRSHRHVPGVPVFSAAGLRTFTSSKQGQQIPRHVAGADLAEHKVLELIRVVGETGSRGTRSFGMIARGGNNCGTHHPQCWEQGSKVSPSQRAPRTEPCSLSARPDLLEHH